MAQGKVTVNNQNLGQGSFPEIERLAIFFGALATEEPNQHLQIDSTSDLTPLTGSPELLDNLKAAQLNGGENWRAIVISTNDLDLQRIGQFVDSKLDLYSPELVVMCDHYQRTDINDFAALAESRRTSSGQRIIFLVMTQRIDLIGEGDLTWAQYATNLASAFAGFVSQRVALIPPTHTNNIGILAGRLCNRAVSIADSPMRVATGPLIGMADSLIDFAGLGVDSATLTALDAAGFSCPQKYVDYPGWYWGDCNLFDQPGGDYQVIENLRPVDKAARAIRILAIRKIADRSLNTTPASIAANKTYFSRPLREMSHSTIFAGQHFPGDIKPPKDDAVQINWVSTSEVEVWLKVQPYNSPKTITANIVLDLSGG